MTERAKLAAEHNLKKRIPAPDIPKKYPSKKKKPYAIESKMVKSPFEWSEFNFLAYLKDWHVVGHYAKLEDAQKALKKFQRTYYSTMTYEYKIVSNGILKMTEECKKLGDLK